MKREYRKWTRSSVRIFLFLFRVIFFFLSKSVTVFQSIISCLFFLSRIFLLVSVIFFSPSAIHLFRISLLLLLLSFSLLGFDELTIFSYVEFSYSYKLWAPLPLRSTPPQTVLNFHCDCGSGCDSHCAIFIPVFHLLFSSFQITLLFWFLKAHNIRCAALWWIHVEHSCIAVYLYFCLSYHLWKKVICKFKFKFKHKIPCHRNNSILCFFDFLSTSFHLGPASVSISSLVCYHRIRFATVFLVCISISIPFFHNICLSNLYRSDLMSNTLNSMLLVFYSGSGFGLIQFMNSNCIHISP